MKYKIIITAIFLTFIIVFTSFMASACSSSSMLTANYWSKASPIVNKQIEECGRPYSELMLEIIPDMANGDYLSLIHI